MIQFNREKLRDKIQACWIGKNMGGTIGAPYEGRRDINDISGFSSKEGEVIPNDDLDLQLVWLKAMEEQGPGHVNAKVLGEYWVNYIMPNWNEYGVGKSNVREGFCPPLTGELNNTMWKNSNGAWIRTEIWACLYPGVPEKAIQYAFYDASVDHGFGEGTCAAIFVAAMESAAFVFSGIDELIDIGLSKIPEDCRVARSVRLVRESFRSGADWKTARQALVEDSRDLGWFQAPANVGFVVLGLLYGGGDFKKSMLTAVNCGDDTDCTGGTLGALLGIIGGTKSLPQDWVKYMGDSIVSICLLNGHGRYPKSNTELTNCIMNLHPVTLHVPFFRTEDTPRTDVVISGGGEDFGGLTPESWYGRDFVEREFACSPYSFRESALLFEAKLEFAGRPKIAPLGTLSGKISVRLKNSPCQRHLHLKWYPCEGWSVQGERSLFAAFCGQDRDGSAETEFTITAGERVEAVNRLLLEISSPGLAETLCFPVQVLG